MKKIQKITTILSALLIILASFAFVFLFQQTEVAVMAESEGGSATIEHGEKTKPVISTDYENGVCVFVYDGTPYHLDLSINSDQELKIERIFGEDESVWLEAQTNEFIGVGTYRLKISAKEETQTYSLPDPVYLTVIVLPRSLVSDKSSGVVGEITIINDDGFCLDNSYSATDISRSQKREIKKAVKNQISYEEEIIEIVKVAPNKEAQNYQTMSLSMELPDNYSSSKNYRIFEYTSTGELKEIGFVINRGEFVLSDVPVDSVIIVTVNKAHPYLWIWILVASLSLVGMVLMLYFYAPRKARFFLEGSKIYVVKLSRRQNFALSDGLENYEWFLDKNLTIKANSFGVKETSRNYYAKLKR